MSDCIRQVRYEIARTDALHRSVSFCTNDYLRVHDWLFLTKVDRAASCGVCCCCCYWVLGPAETKRPDCLAVTVGSGHDCDCLLITGLPADAVS